MKYLHLLITCLCISSNIFSQTEKHHWMLGLSGNGTVYHEELQYDQLWGLVNGKVTQINVSGNIGYFFDDRFLAGIRSGISIEDQHNFTHDFMWGKYNNKYLGPFVRYYFMNNDRNFNVLVDACYQAGRVTNEEKTGGPAKMATIMAGPEFFFNASLGMDFLVGYMYQEETNTDAQLGYHYQRNGVFLSVSLQFHFIKERNRYR